MCRPLGVRIGSVIPPTGSAAIALAANEGIWLPRRQPSEVLAALRPVVDALGARRALLGLRGRRGGRDRDQDVREVVLDFADRRALALRHALVDLPRRDVDARVDVALPQLADGHLLSNLVAIARVVETLRLERRGQVAEGNAVALGDLVERLVERLVGHLDAEPVGPLHLHLLHHEPLEDLLPQQVSRRQRLPLLLEAFRDDADLLVQGTAQHDAVVDDRGDAVEQHAAGAQFLGPGAEGEPGQQADRQQALWNQGHIRCGARSGARSIHE